MDPQIQNLGVQLAEAAVRNSATAVGDKIRAVRARKEDKATIEELDGIVTELLSDKNELVRIAQSFESELVAQRISADDIDYITRSLIPILKQVIESSGAQQGDSHRAEAMIGLLEPLLSVETVTMLQLLGFNFSQAIGKPLTDLVAQLISSRGQASSDIGLELQRLNIEREIAYLGVAKDTDAYERFLNFTGSR
jgi:Fe2+ transport system protein B